VISFDEWKRLSEVPSFGRLLMAAPLGKRGLPKRNRRPLRDADL